MGRAVTLTLQNISHKIIDSNDQIKCIHIVPKILKLPCKVYILSMINKPPAFLHVKYLTFSAGTIRKKLILIRYIDPHLTHINIKKHYTLVPDVIIS